MMQLTGRSVRTVFALTETGPRAWEATVDGTWRGWTGPHGGVIAGLLVEVSRMAAPDGGAVRAVDTRFLGRPGEGRFRFDATVHAVGRSTTVVDVTARQGGAAVVAGTITLGRIGTRGRQPDRVGADDAKSGSSSTAASRATQAVRGRESAAGVGRGEPAGVAHRDGRGDPSGRSGTGALERSNVEAIDVPAPERCARFALPPEIVPVGAHLDIRPAAGPLPLTGSSEAWMCAWISLVPELDTDAAALAVLADALPPGIFPMLRAPLAVPTVAMSLYLHTDLAAAPAQPVLVKAANVSTSGGWSVDDVDIRDREGRLLAQSRQTRRVLG
ncbi:acyl-CoA thioesterase II [Nocardia sp. CC227C]|uniref:acyl-CoA thioesterase n=1 Tax=Nocardia sp. CC227C TaxID=3044562 RepID=UPI00278BF261|nr:acyl-CoA thioesterase domain-containing protein [Nocardia sp. CC227C]